MKRIPGLVFLTLMFACHDQVPARGTMDIRLETTSTSDGAILINVLGGSVTGVHPGPGLEVTSTVDSLGTHLLFVGNLQTGSIGWIEIPAAGQATRYLAVVEQVADRTSFVLLDPSRYHITLLPVLGE